jgi:hypothetical protein
VSVDLALRATFRNFATLFLIVAAVTVPLHVVHAFLYRDVEAVRDIRDEIAELEPDDPVREVTSNDLDAYRTTSLWIVAAEIALVPLLAGAARDVLSADSRSELPGVGSAWAHSLSAWRTSTDSEVSFSAVAVGLGMAAAVASMAGQITAFLAEPIPPDVAFGPLGLGRGVAYALGAPFFLVPLALYVGKAKARGSSADSLAWPDN